MADSVPSEEDSEDSELTENLIDIPKGVAVYEISGPFFFASARQYSAVMKRIGLKSKVLIIRMRYVPFIDSTGLHNLKDTIQELQKQHIHVILSGVQSGVLVDLEKNKIMELVGTENLLSKFDEAIESAKGFI